MGNLVFTQPDWQVLFNINWFLYWNNFIVHILGWTDAIVFVLFALFYFLALDVFWLFLKESKHLIFICLKEWSGP